MCKLPVIKKHLISSGIPKITSEVGEAILLFSVSNIQQGGSRVNEDY
jgi:hypothetical protein